MQNTLFKTNICMILLFSMLVFPPKKASIAASTTGETEQYPVTLETNGGTLIDYDKNQAIFFQPGEPLKLPKAKKKGYVFCGWSTKPKSNVGWLSFAGENKFNPLGTTNFWHQPKKLYAQYVKVTIKKPGKRKLKISWSKWNDATELLIGFSANKSFSPVTPTSDIRIERHQGSIRGPININNCSLKYNKKKKTLSLTLSKLKAKKKYYLRFRYSTYSTENDEAGEEVYCFGDTIMMSVKM